MNITKLRENLKMDEGWRAKPYHCSAGKTTIGYGRNLTDNGISKAEGEMFLSADIARVVIEIEQLGPWFRGLNEVRQRVLANMCFNLGYPKLLLFRKMLAACSVGDWEKAADEMVDSDWYRQVKSRGPRLVAMMRTGVDAE